MSDRPTDTRGDTVSAEDGYASPTPGDAGAPTALAEAQALSDAAIRRDATPTPTLNDWLMLLALMSLGGSAFAMIRVAVEDLPPSTIAVSRLWLGAGVAWILMRMRGRRLPPLLEKREGRRLALDRRWAFMIPTGLIGYATPFYLFPWGQRTVDSGLAGIYMAFMPLSAIVLAHFFANETLTRRKLAGFVLGFAGIGVLMGGSAFGEATNASFHGQFAIFIAANCYSVAAIITRRTPDMPARAMATGVLLAAAVAATPLGLLNADYGRLPEWPSVVATIGLGVFATGFGGFFVTAIIRSAGPSFLALVNYMTPLWAVLVGALLFGERLGWNAFIALGFIFVGVAISQTPPRRFEMLRAKLFSRK